MTTSFPFYIRFSVTLLFSLLLSLSASAFHDPTVGRWVSRDPIAESGGKNLYEFAKNAALQYIDPTGQYPTTSCWIRLPVCNGKVYDPRWECCCDGKVVSTTAIDTGVIKHKWSENSGGPGKVHVWLTWDGGSADSNSDSVIMSPGRQMVESPAGATPEPSTPTSLKLSPCGYDFKKLNACLTRKASELKGSLGGDCRDFANKLIDDCKAESRGCTAPP